MDDESKKLSVHEMAEAFRQVLSEGEGPEGENRRAILIKRIPIICNDILQIKKDIGDMNISMSKSQTNSAWQKWLLMGIAGGIGLLALKQLGV